MKVALDTNVLVYAEGLNGAAKRAVMLPIVIRLPKADKLAPLNVLGELFNVLVRKARWSEGKARDTVSAWRRTVQTGETTDLAMLAAFDLAVDHQLAIWDALVLAVSAEAGCRIILSEDMQHGLTWRGLTVVNPFLQPMHPLLAEAIAS